MLPMAATVPGPEPIMAAKNRQPRMVVMPRPPRIRPTNSEATSTIWRAMPPFSMSAPAKMKPTNPHDNHLGITDCNECHSVHEDKKSIPCDECHKFKFERAK